MESKEAEEKISSIRTMIEKHKSWKRCDRQTMAEINRAYADAIGAEGAYCDLNRVEAEKKVIDHIGEPLIEFSKIGGDPPMSVLFLVCIVWRWEVFYAGRGKMETANQFKASRLQLCAAANAPLWVGALYASEAVADVMSTKPTDF